MCRWFAYISTTEPCLLEDVILLPEHAIAKQVHERYLPYLTHYEPETTPTERSLRNSPFNLDGLGLVWYTNVRASFGEADGPLPIAYKILRQPSTDPVLHSLCAHTAAHCVLAHIRAASGGTVVAECNNHPFVFGRHAFMHNGSIAGFERIKRRMALEVSEEAMVRVRGTTDSELLAALFFTLLEGRRGERVWEEAHPLEEMRACLEGALRRVLALQDEAGGRAWGVGRVEPERLLAVRFRNHVAEHPPSLYLSTRAGVSLNRKFPGHPDREGVDNGAVNLKAASEHGAHVIVASEPTTYAKSDWELIPKNTCVMVGEDMVVRQVPVDVPF